MAGENYCAGYGYLAGSDTPLLTHEMPALRDEDATWSRAKACGELFCLACGYQVKHWENASFLQPFTAIRIYPPKPGEMEAEAEAVELRYDSDDPAMDIKQSKGVRAYSCRCFRVSISSPEGMFETNLPVRWRCAGHRA